MEKLTVADIDQWQQDNGEDFLIDGPISYESWNKFHDVLLDRLKNHAVIGPFMNQDADDVEEMLFDPENGFWCIDGVEDKIFEELCEAAWETKADILAEIREHEEG